MVTSKLFNENNLNGLSKEDLRTIVLKVQQEDAGWLENVLGKSLIEEILSPNQTALSLGNEIQNQLSDETIQNSNETVESNTYTKEIDEDDINDVADTSTDLIEVYRLGYSKNEIDILKTSVINLIIKYKVQHPSRGIPIQWIDEKKYKLFNQMKTKSTSNPTNKKKISPTKEKIKSVPSDEEVIQDERDLPDEISFWPPADEFKDMLIEESKLRMNVLGDWLAPLLRSENKWRYRLYKGWLSFLDEGFGDRYDMEVENYGDVNNGDSDYDEDSDDMEKKRVQKFRYDTRSNANNPTKNRIKKGLVQNNFENPIKSNIKEKKVVENPSVIRRDDGSSRRIKESRAKYDEFIQKQIVNKEQLNEWINVEEEERQIEKSFRSRNDIIDKNSWFSEEMNEDNEDENGEEREFNYDREYQRKSGPVTSRRASDRMPMRDSRSLDNKRPSEDRPLDDKRPSVGRPLNRTPPDRIPSDDRRGASPEDDEQKDFEKAWDDSERRINYDNLLENENNLIDLITRELNKSEK